MKEYRELKVLENNILNDLAELNEERIVTKVRNLIWAVNEDIDGYGPTFGNILAVAVLVSLILGGISAVTMGFLAFIMTIGVIVGSVLVINSLIGPNANEYRLTKIKLWLSKNKRKKLEKELALVKNKLEEIKISKDDKKEEINEIDKSRQILMERLDLLKRYALIKELKKIPRNEVKQELEEYSRVRK